MQDFIDDGYTVHARIEAVLGQHNRCDFSFRPLTDDAGSARNKKINQAPESKQADLKRELIREQLQWWSLQRNGQTAPIDDEHLRMLPTSLSNALYLVCLGFMSPTCELDEHGNELDPSDNEADAKN